MYENPLLAMWGYLLCKARKIYSKKVCTERICTERSAKKFWSHNGTNFIGSRTGIDTAMTYMDKSIIERYNLKELNGISLLDKKGVA